MDLYDQMAETSKAFVLDHLDAYLAQDPSILSRHLHPDAHRRVGPARFEQDFRPDGWSNGEYEECLAPKLRITKGMKLEINDVLVDTKKLRATVHSSHLWTLPTAGQSSSWSMEFIWVLDMNKEGDKVTKILEFVDTQHSVTVGRHLKQLEIDGNGNKH